jgi:hypothetical protein
LQGEKEELMEIQLTPLMVFFVLFLVFLFCAVVPIGAFVVGLNVGVKIGSNGQRTLGGVMPGRSSLKPGEGGGQGPAEQRKFKVVPGVNLAEDDPLAVLDGQVNRFLSDLGRRAGGNFVDPELAGVTPKQARATGVTDE